MRLGDLQKLFPQLDIQQLVKDLEMEDEKELFDLADREAWRPGCQFGVLIRVLRYNKQLGIEWEEEEFEE